MTDVPYRPYLAALIVVDCQTAFFRAQGTPETEFTADRICKAAAFAKEKRVALYSVFSNASTPEQAGVPQTLADMAYNLRKMHESAFSGSNLESLLRRAHRSQLIVAGFHTTTCVQRTVINALKAGFRVAVASDLVGEGDRGRHLSQGELQALEQAALNNMRKKGAIIAPLNQILI